MSKRTVDITRRKVLASLGAVGAAGAATGLGTSALFSDSERFENNTLAAGDLDLLVDWQQTYQGPNGLEYVNAHPDHDEDGTQSIPHPTEDYAVEYTERNLVEFLTCDTEGFDDDYDFNGSREQDSLVELSDVKPGDTGEITFSLHLCDNPGYIWMQGQETSNSENGYTEPEPTPEGGGDPDGRGNLAENIDVEMWYDHDCDNLVSSGVEADMMLTLDFSGSMLYDRYGGVVSEESLEVPQSNGGSTVYDRTTKIDLVELATKRFVNYLDEVDADVQLGVAYFDGSQGETARIGVLQELTGNLQTVFGSLDDLRQSLANVVSGDSTTSPDDGDGDPDPSKGAGIATGTYIGEGVEAAQDELASARARSGVEFVNVVLSDGESFKGGGLNYESPQDAANAARNSDPAPATDLYTIAVDTGSAGDSTLRQMAGPAEGTGGNLSYFYDVDDPESIPTVFSSIADLFAPEEVFFEGTLADALDELSAGDGIPLDANGLTTFDELTDPDDAAGRDCFHPAVTQCLGFRWEVPADVGNEIQGDSIGFDLGFFTQQCRHNDGTMM